MALNDLIPIQRNPQTNKPILQIHSSRRLKRILQLLHKAAAIRSSRLIELGHLAREIERLLRVVLLRARRARQGGEGQRETKRRVRETFKLSTLSAVPTTIRPTTAPALQARDTRAHNNSLDSRLLLASQPTATSNDQIQAGLQMRGASTGAMESLMSPGSSLMGSRSVSSGLPAPPQQHPHLTTGLGPASY